MSVIVKCDRPYGKRELKRMIERCCFYYVQIRYWILLVDYVVIGFESLKLTVIEIETLLIISRVSLTIE